MLLKQASLLQNRPFICHIPFKNHFYCQINIIQNGLGMIPNYLNKMLKPPISGIQGFRSQKEAYLKTRTYKNTRKEEKKKDDRNRNSFIG